MKGNDFIRVGFSRLAIFATKSHAIFGRDFGELDENHVDPLRAVCRQHMAGRRSLEELREYLMPAITLPPRKSRVYLPSK